MDRHRLGQFVYVVPGRSDFFEFCSMGHCLDSVDLRMAHSVSFRRRSEFLELELMSGFFFC